MEEPPRNENSSVCSKVVSDPWFRARGFCKRGSRYCNEATSPAPYVVLRHNNALCSNKRIRNCSHSCLLFSIKNLMHFSYYKRSHHLISHNTIYNLLTVFNYFLIFYSLHGGWLLRNLQNWAVLKITYIPSSEIKRCSESCHSLDF